MTVLHTHFYIVVDTQRGCHTLKLYRNRWWWYIRDRCTYACRTKQGRTTRALWETSWCHGMSNARVEVSHKPRFNCTAQLTIACTHRIIHVFTHNGYLYPISLKLEWYMFRILRPIYFTKPCSEDLEFQAQVCNYRSVQGCERALKKKCNGFSHKLKQCLTC